MYSGHRYSKVANLQNDVPLLPSSNVTVHIFVSFRLLIIPMTVKDYFVFIAMLH